MFQQSELETPTPDIQEQGPDPITNPLGYLHSLNKRAPAQASGTPPAAAAAAATPEKPASEDVEMKEVTETTENSDTVAMDTTDAANNDNVNSQQTPEPAEAASSSLAIDNAVSDSQEKEEEQMEVDEEMPEIIPAASPISKTQTDEKEPEVATEETDKEPEMPVLEKEQTPEPEESMTTEENIQTAVELIVVKPEKVDSTIEEEKNTEETVEEAKEPEKECMEDTQEPLEKHEPIVIKPEPEEQPPADVTPASTPSVLSPAPPRGVDRLMREHDVLMSPAETLSDIDDEAIIRAQFTDGEEEVAELMGNRPGTPILDADEELLNSRADVTSPTKIQITVSRKLPTIMPSPERNSPSPTGSSPPPPPPPPPPKVEVDEVDGITKKEDDTKEEVRIFLTAFHVL